MRKPLLTQAVGITRDAADTIQELNLIAAVKQGDRNAFHQLYERHSGKVYALCYRLTGHKEMAEDATQEVFIQAWNKIQHFREESQFSTWLHTITANTTITYMRKHKSWLNRFINLANNHNDDFHTDTTNSLLELDQYIVRLPDQSRLVFVLHAIEGYRHEEIADKLNIAVGTSKSHLHRAKSLLKQWLEA